MKKITTSKLNIKWKKKFVIKRKHLTCCVVWKEWKKILKIPPIENNGIRKIEREEKINDCITTARMHHQTQRRQKKFRSNCVDCSIWFYCASSTFSDQLKSIINWANYSVSKAKCQKKEPKKCLTIFPPNIFVFAESIHFSISVHTLATIVPAGKI